MSVDLGPSFPVTFAGIPPHVSQEDFRLWEIFRRDRAKDYVRFYFDVALGEGELVDGPVSEKVAAAWKRLTRFRADVVGETVSGWDLIEFRPHAGPGAIGALQTYVTLWGTGPPDARPVRALLVTDRCAEDIQTVARLAGIAVVCLDQGSL